MALPEEMMIQNCTHTCTGRSFECLIYASFETAEFPVLYTACSKTHIREFKRSFIIQNTTTNTYTPVKQNTTTNTYTPVKQNTTTNTYTPVKQNTTTNTHTPVKQNPKKIK
jgi:hypothetical protein